MKALRASISLAISLTAGSVIADSRTHCVAGETDFFTCAIAESNKVVSLCGKNDENTTWLQYRFGFIGHPEMVYPAVRRGSMDRFSGRHQSSREEKPYDQYDIWFHVGSYDYSVSASAAGDEPKEKEISVYVYYRHRQVNRSSNIRSIKSQGSLNCSQPSEKLMGRLIDLYPQLQPEPEIEK